MTDTITITPLDNVWVRLDAPDGVLREISGYFQFEVPGAQFMKRRAGYKHWDQKIRLFKLRTRTIYRGLVPRVVQFAEQRGYEIISHVPEVVGFGDDLDEFLEDMELPFPLRDYQYEALKTALNDERGIIVSPTGSGKSYIIYLLQQILAGKTLIIVPTIGLVTQMAKDFRDYGCEEEIHGIHGGIEKTSDARLFISTWQSIYELPEDYFNQFDVVICDEVHLAKAASLKMLLEKCQAQNRYGFTGTLDDCQAHQLILEGLFGSVTKVTTTNDLVQEQQLSPLKVKLCVLEYPEAARKQMRRVQYQDEVEFIAQNPARLAFVAQLVKTLKGNALVLFNLIEKQGKELYKQIEDASPNKAVHFIIGEVDGDTREAVRQEVENDKDREQVIVATYGVFGTGINIKRLHHIVLASSGKSKIRTLQAIGRGLRKAAGKKKVIIWDIVDDLRVGAYSNFLWRHAEIRADLYAREKFPITLIKVPAEVLCRLGSTSVETNGTTLFSQTPVAPKDD